MRTVILAFCLMPFFVAAQAYTTSQTTSKKARQAYEDGIIYDNRNDTEKAAEAFGKAVELDPQFIDAQLEWAAAQFKLGNLAGAESGLEKALALSSDYRPIVWKKLAEIEFEQDKFAEAAEHAETFLRFDYKNEKTRREAQRLAMNAKFALEAVKNPVPFELKNAGPGINTPEDEYLPSLTADESVLVFTRLDPGRDENFYAAEHDSTGNWRTAAPLDDVNTTDNEGAEAISADGTWLVFTACNRQGDGSQGSCDLYWSQQKNRGWSKPSPFSATINSPAWDAQPCISADGKTLIFSSERPGGQGSKDLWMTTRQPGGKWSAPQNLGPDVNTPWQEQCPFLHPDGQTLYFTSDGHPGMGSNDLYFSRRNADGTWGRAQNLGYPVNTKASEGALVVSLDGRTAWFATNKPGGKGKNDIYSFPLPEAARPQAVTYVRAKVRDAATRKLLSAKVDFVDLSTGQLFVSANTRADGTFLVCLPAGKDYALNVSKKDYLFASEHFSLAEAAVTPEPFLMEINLQPIVAAVAVVDPGKPAAPPAAGKPVTLRNVFFETGAATLKPESASELNRLADLLTENPMLNIQINGHTDSDGEDATNLRLSEARAKTVYEFLLKKGIAAARLRFKGFGESAPVAANDTPEGKAQNRRTEFEVF